jgi:SAM-dependent MidA family methyltransferase
MEQALYHPEHGYYSTGRAVIGRRGDYFTNVSVGPLFGRLMALQFEEVWERLGCPGEFVIVEQGAHGGEFAADVLQAARSGDADFFRAIRYIIVEPFAALASRQREALQEFAGKTEWSPSLEALPPFRGVYFSNELLDSFPVHLVKWDGATWLERHVTERDNVFVFVDMPARDPQLAEQLARIPRLLPVGYETEVNVAALDWVDALAQRLEAGFAVAVDYGFARDEYYAPHRTAGTLRGYAEHRAVSSPLDMLGRADITAHVDWTSIAERAEQRGLQIAGFTDQHHFLTGLLAAHPEFASSSDAKTPRALQTLLHPAHLGMKFQFLVLQKDVPGDAALAGLRFARDPRAALGCNAAVYCAGATSSTN